MNIIIVHHIDSGIGLDNYKAYAHHKNTILYDGGHLPLFSYLVTSHYILTCERYSETYYTIILY